MALPKHSMRIPAELMERLSAEADRLWGAHESKNEAANAVLRDWISKRERQDTERRLRTLEERLLTLERRPTGRTVSPEEPLQTDVPKALDQQVSKELGFGRVPLDSLIDEVWSPAPEPDDKERKKVLERIGDDKREGTVRPEALLGFRSGGPVDVAPYHELGYPPARADYRYTLKDHGFREYVETIIATRHYDPILVAHARGKLFVLDGLARLSAVGLARRIDPGDFPNIRYTFVRRSIDDKKRRKLMITANLNNGPRALTLEEYEQAMTRLMERHQ